MKRILNKNLFSMVKLHHILIAMLQRSFIFLLFATVTLVPSGCGENDGFPDRQFVGYFDLTDPLYSQNIVFTARWDHYGTYLGINGIVVYRQGDLYNAFDLMCPYEKKETCSVEVDPEDPAIAVCECCGSRFLLASPNGELIEGPAPHGLKKYSATVVQNILVVTSSY
ncbi:Rieske (2Fe-2S) protein [Thermophagus sp. OGC60D27]|uniref:Rieske (2Fe-2S) protein n=1 Tax=Thermophagus sp. OGC60D27 TaxID=3458415 RepID=UPI004037635E